MYDPIQALFILIGAAFAVGVCGAALAIGMSLGLRWFPLTVRGHTTYYGIMERAKNESNCAGYNHRMPWD